MLGVFCNMLSKETMASIEALKTDWFVESLETIRNIASTVIILKQVGRENLIPTQLELLFLEAQALLDDFCIDDGSPVGFVDK